VANSRRLPVARKEEIEEIAWQARADMGLAPFDYVPVARLMELVLPRLIEDYDFRVTDADMDGAEAVTHPSKPRITFSERAYRGLCWDHKRERMTALHEVGHMMLHTGKVSFAFRRSTRNQRDIEAEADLFAAAFIMPECAFKRITSIKEAMKTFGVSRDAAYHRARDLKMWDLIEGRAEPGTSKKKGHGKTRTP
jgi:hypothetical protein